jgi:hypothetical protein
LISAGRRGEERRGDGIREGKGEGMVQPEARDHVGIRNGADWTGLNPWRCGGA